MDIIAKYLYTLIMSLDGFGLSINDEDSIKKALEFRKASELLKIVIKNLNQTIGK